MHPAATILALLCTFVIGPSPVGRLHGAQHIGIPAYLSPDVSSGREAWMRVAQSVPAVGIAIANVNSSPGTTFDSNWANVIWEVHKAGAIVIGYVDTGYYGTTGHATRSGQKTFEAWTAQIHQDVDTWYQFYGTYGLDGVFFDQSPSLCGPNDAWADLYAAIRTYAVQRHPGAKVVANPGEAAEPCYAKAADIFVMFEGDYASYLNWQPPDWQLQVDPNRIWHLVYKAAGRAEMETAIALSRQRNAGYIYVTNADLPNPWASLPPYWDEELLRTRRSP